MQASASLLEPIYAAQLDSIRASRVKAMDETPIKAGRAAPGKMKAAYFWPVYGEQDESVSSITRAGRPGMCRRRSARRHRRERYCKPMATPLTRSTQKRGG